MLNTLMSDLSQNYYKGNQQFVMGKFNVFPKMNYLYLKYYLADDFGNVYMHDDLPSVEALTAKLSNITNDFSLAVSRIAASKAGNCFVFKITVI